MKVFPQIEFADARALSHGEVVLTRQGEYGLIWKPKRQGLMQGIPTSSYALTLRSMTHQSLYDASLNQIYIARLVGSLVLRVDTSSLFTDVQNLTHGDLAYSAETLPQATSRPLIVLNDAREGGLIGFSLSDSSTSVHLHQGYIYAFKRWTLYLRNGDDVGELLVDWPPPSASPT